MQATLWEALLLMVRQQVMLVANQIIQAITVDIACTGDCVTTTITCYFTIDNKSPCWVVCISNITQINSGAINLSAIADASNPLGGFVINGEAAGDASGCSVSSAGHKIYPQMICDLGRQNKRLQSNHPNHHH
jgi:hypothetical protein